MLIQHIYTCTSVLYRACTWELKTWSSYKKQLGGHTCLSVPKEYVKAQGWADDEEFALCPLHEGVLQWYRFLKNSVKTGCKNALYSNRTNFIVISVPGTFCFCS